MKKILKWFGIVLAGLFGLIAIALAAFYIKGLGMVTRRYTITPENLVIPQDAASISYGEHLAQAICTDCHGEKLSGKVLLDVSFATIYSPNLTPGKGGAGSEFTDADWVRAMRHGVDNEGRGLFMPSNVFWNFSDKDLVDIVAYLKSLPPVDNELPAARLDFLGVAMTGIGIFGPVPADIIAHNQRPTVVPVEVTIDYGKYLSTVSGCPDCHGKQLAGGRSQKPGAMTAPNLTPGGELKTWSSANFISTIRDGVSPGGHKLNPDEMPWKRFRIYKDDELIAIFLYLQSLPPASQVAP